MEWKLHCVHKTKPYIKSSAHDVRLFGFFFVFRRETVENHKKHAKQQKKNYKSTYEILLSIDKIVKRLNKCYIQTKYVIVFMTLFIAISIYSINKSGSL